MAFFFSTPAGADAVSTRPDLILSQAAASRQSELRRQSSRLARRATQKLLGIDPSGHPAFFGERRFERRLGR
ncbi:MAG TPA: hypothetical protein VFO69_09815 [Allosphingosinicella sp.]|nr:hypothetical protein [Allosphingosinicella sp.]